MRFFKILAVFTALILAVLCLVSCKDEEPVVLKDVYYTVTFNTAGGSDIPSIKVLGGSKLSEPAIPERAGFIFNGWMNGTVKWNFSNDTVNSDITLVASWINAKAQFDYEILDGTAMITGYKGSDKAIVIPEFIDGIKVNTIGEGAFSGISAEKISNITLGDNITFIENSAFENCGAAIVLEGEILSIGEKAFFGCEGLESVTLGEGVKFVPYAAFSGCTSLREITINSVETIEENAFEGCAALSEITVRSAIVSIADSAFLDCDALESIYYYGTEEEWESADIAVGNGGNDALLNAELYLYSEQEPEGETKDKYWYIDDNGNKRLW